MPVETEDFESGMWKMKWSRFVATMVGRNWSSTQKGISADYESHNLKLTLCKSPVPYR